MPSAPPVSKGRNIVMRSGDRIGIEADRHGVCPYIRRHSINSIDANSDDRPHVGTDPVSVRPTRQ